MGREVFQLAFWPTLVSFIPCRWLLYHETALLLNELFLHGKHSLGWMKRLLIFCQFYGLWLDES
jgi:hypothetical protein